MRLSVGIDPGVTMLGIVGKGTDGPEPLFYGTFHSEGDTYAKDFSITQRVMDLSREVYEWVYGQMVHAGKKKKVTEVIVSIERPVWTKNARAFQIQWRLYQQLVEKMSQLPVDTICELDNGTIKKFHTGDGKATKLDMVLAGSFDGPGYGNKAEQEALADAEAIADCGLDPLFGERTPVQRYSTACHIGPTISG